MAIVEDDDLLTLVDCLLTMLDASLLITFVERWNKEISSFNLLFGEITITFDDNSSSLHPPIIGSFFIAPLIIPKLACITAIQDLGVTGNEVL
ncbi:unnamed protein product [Lathyrus oleraceus]